MTKQRQSIPLDVSTVGVESFSHSLIQEALKSAPSAYNAALAQTRGMERATLERCAAAFLTLVAVPDCAEALAAPSALTLRTVRGAMRSSGSRGGKGKRTDPYARQRANVLKAWEGRPNQREGALPWAKRMQKLGAISVEPRTAAAWIRERHPKKRNSRRVPGR